MGKMVPVDSCWVGNCLSSLLSAPTVTRYEWEPLSTSRTVVNTGALEVDDQFSHRKVAPLSFPNSQTPLDPPPPKSQLHQVVYYGRIQRIHLGGWMAQMLIRSSATYLEDVNKDWPLRISVNVSRGFAWLHSPFLPMATWAREHDDRYARWVFKVFDLNSEKDPEKCSCS